MRFDDPQSIRIPTQVRTIAIRPSSEAGTAHHNATDFAFLVKGPGNIWFWRLGVISKIRLSANHFCEVIRKLLADHAASRLPECTLMSRSMSLTQVWLWDASAFVPWASPSPGRQGHWQAAAAAIGGSVARALAGEIQASTPIAAAFGAMMCGQARRARP